MTNEEHLAGWTRAKLLRSIDRAETKGLGLLFYGAQVAPLLRVLERDGLVTLHDKCPRLTDLGRKVARS